MFTCKYLDTNISVELVSVDGEVLRNFAITTQQILTARTDWALRAFLYQGVLATCFAIQKDGLTESDDAGLRLPRIDIRQLIVTTHISMKESKTPN